MNSGPGDAYPLGATWAEEATNFALFSEVANGEKNQDGFPDNRSWNCGVEGPTDDPAILALRARQKRNFLATVLLSHGVPMLLGGDEMNRTQLGNNNPYNQDNEVSWFDWDKRDDELTAFVQKLIELRRAHPVFQPCRYPAALHRQRCRRPELIRLCARTVHTGIAGARMRSGRWLRGSAV